MKSVYFFCQDLDKDPVGYHVFKACQELFPMIPSGKTLDGLEAWMTSDERGNEYHFVLTSDTLSHIFDQTLERIQELFPHPEFDFAVIVNWHGGNNAPDKVFAFHGVGHPAVAAFAPSNGCFMANIARHVAKGISSNAMLADWRVAPEATHYSGIPYGCDARKLETWQVPQADLEIGSSSDSWSHPAAARLLAETLIHIFDETVPAPTSALFVGGVHFEPTLQSLMINGDAKGTSYVFPHALTYPWIVAEAEGVENIEDELYRRVSAAFAASVPKPSVIVFHDKAKSVLKNAAKRVAAEQMVDCVNHKNLKNQS